MHIAIDTRSLEGGHGRRGSGVYTKLLISSLQKYKSDNTYTLFTRVQEIPKSADVVHFPSFDPFFLTLPISKPKQSVVTVHDLIPLAYPSHFPVGIRGEIKWQIQRWSLAHAAAIITDSSASQKDIARLVPTSLSRISVVPLAPNPTFVKSVGSDVLARVKNRYKLPEKFLLYVGDVNWNKNVLGMLKAVAHVKDVPLVLVGSVFEAIDIPEMQVITTTIDELNLAQRVIKTGYADDEVLRALYTLASVSITPSFAEGFGFPVLEAMLCGTPSVVATGSSLDEIAGPSIRVDPNSPDTIASGIQKALKIKKDIWKKQAADWLKQYSWEKVAHETFHVYETVAA